MNESPDDEATKEELRAELRQTRSRVRQLESELAETNEGMVALTLELENAKERYQTIFEESTDGILLIDPDRDAIHEANPRVCELLGYDREELKDLSPEDIFTGENVQSASFTEAVVQGWADGFRCSTKDGRRIDVDISASMVTLDGQSLLLASLRDVTMRKRREQRLQVLTRIFRHNLRNDGNVIQGHADLLYDDLAETELEESVVKIRDTIDDILELSGKVRRVQDVLDRNRIDLVAIDDVLRNHRDQFHQRYPAATLDVDVPDQEVRVGRRLSVAIQEAVENAVIHADSDVTVTIAVEVDQEREQARVAISDDGPGIPEHEIQVVRSGSETPQTHGNGIGLWFIQWLVDSLGGEMSIQRGEQSGTTISMVVPIELAEEDADSSTAYQLTQ